MKIINISKSITETVEKNSARSYEKSQTCISLFFKNSICKQFSLLSINFTQPCSHTRTWDIVTTARSLLHRVIFGICYVWFFAAKRNWGTWNKFWKIIVIQDVNVIQKIVKLMSMFVWKVTQRKPKKAKVQLNIRIQVKRYILNICIVLFGPLLFKYGTFKSAKFCSQLLDSLCVYLLLVQWVKEAVKEKNLVVVIFLYVFSLKINASACFVLKLEIKILKELADFFTLILTNGLMSIVCCGQRKCMKMTKADYRMLMLLWQEDVSW